MENKVVLYRIMKNSSFGMTFYVFVVSVVITGCLIFYSNSRTASYKIGQNAVIPAGTDIEYSLESSNIYSDGSAVISGWLKDEKSFMTALNFGTGEMQSGNINNIHLGVYDGDSIVILATHLKSADTDCEDEIRDYGKYYFTSYVSNKNLKKYADKKMLLISQDKNGTKKYVDTGITLREGIYENE